MAPKAKQARTSSAEQAQEDTQGPAEQAQSQAQPHPPVEHRKTAPIAPKATSGNSPQVVLAIRNALAEALYSKHEQAIEAGIQKIEAVGTQKAHPTVAMYKAEILDYLRGKLPRVEA